MKSQTKEMKKKKQEMNKPKIYGKNSTPLKLTRKNHLKKNRNKSEFHCYLFLFIPNVFQTLQIETFFGENASECNSLVAMEQIRFEKLNENRPECVLQVDAFVLIGELVDIDINGMHETLDQIGRDAIILAMLCNSNRKSCYKNNVNVMCCAVCSHITSTSLTFSYLLQHFVSGPGPNHGIAFEILLLVILFQRWLLGNVAQRLNLVGVILGFSQRMDVNEADNMSRKSLNQIVFFERLKQHVRNEFDRFIVN